MTERVARRFRALAEPMRLRILQVLEGGEKSVTEIVELLGSSQSNISRHLKALCQEGLLERRRAGLNVCYRIADPMVNRLCDLICRGVAEQTRSQLAELESFSAARGTDTELLGSK
ncbi:MAG TPA: metalloregulator ArsR/SmtB family transcription factor [Candidatus Angelobacter sp.]|nr:metalloregulator ArsR/SmtB family transcription factor [Candidatus Angelobacter sp.]